MTNWDLIFRSRALKENDRRRRRQPKKTIDEDVQKARGRTDERTTKGRIEKYSGHARVGFCMSACTVKLLYEIKSNVRVLIVYVAHSSRFDSRSACDLLDCFLSELIDVEGRGKRFHAIRQNRRSPFLFQTWRLEQASKIQQNSVGT